jgi:hypothetical protein
MGQYMARDYSASLVKFASIMAAGVVVQAGALSSSKSPANGTEKYGGTLIIIYVVVCWSESCVAQLHLPLLGPRSVGRRDFW